MYMIPLTHPLSLYIYMYNSRRKYRVKNTQFECSKKKKLLKTIKKYI